MGMGWKVSDLSKPQVMVESSCGDSHPGSAHLNIFVEEAVKAVNKNGGKAARYFATDMCDGIAQGMMALITPLHTRDAITNLIEAQANATVFDGGVFIASCDKSCRLCYEHRSFKGHERDRSDRRRHGGA